MRAWSKIFLLFHIGTRRKFLNPDYRKDHLLLQVVFSAFNEGGDSEWLINYLILSISGKCDKNMSNFLKN